MTDIQDKLTRLSNSEDYQTTLQELRSNSKRFDGSKLSLAELDNWRYTELPHVVNSRFPDVYITLDELVLLHDWKMAKGKFRPALPKLIRSNMANEVVEKSRLAFKLLTDYQAMCNGEESGEKGVDGGDDGGQDRGEDHFGNRGQQATQHDNENPNAPTSTFNLNEYLQVAKSSMVQLAKAFKGVGPATASLIVSLYQLNIKNLNRQLCLPFLCDESFLFLNPTYGKLKYNYNEYFVFYLPKIIALSGINNKNVDATSKIFNLNVIEKSLWCLEKHRTSKDKHEYEHGANANANSDLIVQINTFLSDTLKRERPSDEDNKPIFVKKKKSR